MGGEGEPIEAFNSTRSVGSWEGGVPPTGDGDHEKEPHQLQV